MAENKNKTTATEGNVTTFVDALVDEQRRADARLLVDLMRQVTGQPAVLWGSAIIGFGTRHYRYPSGREGVTVAVGSSPRKAETVLYLTGGLDEYEDLLLQLGKHRVGKSCLYLKQVGRADAETLREIVARSYRMAAES